MATGAADQIRLEAAAYPAQGLAERAPQESQIQAEPGNKCEIGRRGTEKNKPPASNLQGGVRYLYWKVIMLLKPCVFP